MFSLPDHKSFESNIYHYNNNYYFYYDNKCCVLSNSVSVWRQIDSKVILPLLDYVSIK